LAAITIDECFPSDISTMIADLARCDRVTTIRLVETDQAKTSIETQEKRLRKDDRTFARLILIEGIDEAAVAVSVESLASTQKASCPIRAMSCCSMIGLRFLTRIGHLQRAQKQKPRREAVVFVFR
jgi:hypothetical protein